MRVFWSVIILGYWDYFFFFWVYNIKVMVLNLIFISSILSIVLGMGMI